ncbi:unnamed protein product, partial [Sphacelaria rigidula]
MSLQTTNSREGWPSSYSVLGIITPHPNGNTWCCSSYRPPRALRLTEHTTALRAWYECEPAPAKTRRALSPGLVGMRGQWSYDYGMHDHQYTPYVHYPPKREQYKACPTPPLQAYATNFLTGSRTCDLLE